MIDAADMVQLGCRLLGLWGVLNAAQWWVDRRSWQPGTALGWDLHGLRSAWWWRSAALARAFQPRWLHACIAVQGVAATWLLVAPLSALTLVALAALIASSGLLILRTFGDGADKMAMVVVMGLLLQVTGLLTASPLLTFAGTLWIGGQLTLCYATAGVAKLLIAGWRDGSSPRGALSSVTYGHRWAAALLSHTGVALTLGWAVILIETLFPLALIAPFPITAALLAGMLALHIAIAIAMGLNTYPLAFVAAYPSLLLLAQPIRVAIGTL